MNVQGITQPIFGKWKIEEKLGAGAFGTVYKIKRESFGKMYYSALKVIKIPQDEGEIKSLRNELGDDKSVSEYYTNFVQAFAKEIELMSELKGNSNIVSFEDHDFIQNEDGIGWTILIRMELLTPFVDYQSKNELNIKDIIKLGIDICSALESCEKKNIIHRDIKPENIFLSDDGRYELGDFGIARELEKTTGGLSKKGTYSYMAPEIYLGKPYNNTVDIYSLGIMLYKFLNHNRAPYLPKYPHPITFSDREKSLQSRMNGDEIPDIKDIPETLNNVVKKACAFDSKDRYQSASEMKKALNETLNTETATVKESNIHEEFETMEKTVGPFGNADIPNFETSDKAEESDEIESIVSAVGQRGFNSFDENKQANKSTVFDENDNGISQNTNQPSLPQKKKLSKGAIAAIVITSLLVIIIAIVAVVSAENSYDDYNYDDGYYDYDEDYYDDSSDDYVDIDLSDNYIIVEEIVSVVCDEFGIEYPNELLTIERETVWIEYNEDFTKYRVSVIESNDGCCIELYDNSKSLDFVDANYIQYPKRYELSCEDIYEFDGYNYNYLYRLTHVFAPWESGYIDYVDQYDGNGDLIYSREDYCDSNGEIIE